MTHPAAPPGEDQVPGAPSPVEVGGTVHIGHAVDSQTQAADFGGWSCFHFTGSEQPVQILPYDSNRHRATITVTVPPPAGTPPVVTGSVTSPAAGAAITSITLPGGTYAVSGSIMLTGTLSAADTSNVGFYLGGTLIFQMQLPPVVGIYPIPPTVIPIPASGAPFYTRAIGAGTAGSVYSGAFVMVPGAPGTETVYVGTQAQCLTKTGGILMPAMTHVIENNQALWAVPDGINAVNVTVLNERWS